MLLQYLTTDAGHLNAEGYKLFKYLEV